MKNIDRAFFIMLCLFVVGCSSLRASEKDRIGTFEQLKQEFISPSNQYQSMPLYVWDYDLNQELLESTMQDLKKAGCGGILIHPRPGLITEYLSDEWYDLYEYAIQKGKEYGIHIWIYDENSYPSGFGGGHVPAEMPESYNQGQGLIMEKYTCLPDTLTDVFLCLEEQLGMFKDITPQLKQKKFTSGNFFCFRKTYYSRGGWYAGYSYVDLIAQGVTDKFIEVTMAGYEKRFGQEFGKTIQGIFTDEPHISSPKGIRWTPDLFQEFKKDWGYELTAHLPALFDKVGDWKRVRHNYISTLLHLFVERWSKPWRAYCDKKGLQWTGHYWEHRWPNITNGGDDMAMYAWHHVPAIDLLFNLYNETTPNNQFGNVRIVREVNSVANQMGNHRTLCEMYGGGGWEETFSDFKRLGDWAYALGINQMNQHLSRITLTGARKYDYPTSFSYHEPWWKYYHYLNDYQSRLSVALSSGRQMNHTLVLKPTTTGWLYYTEGKIGEELNILGHSFQDFVTSLEKKQVTYDIGSEEIIKQHGSIREGTFVVGQVGYNTVVIPPHTENLDSSTFHLLKEFVEKKGRLILFSRPVLLDGAYDATVESFFRSTDLAITYVDSLSVAFDYSGFHSDELEFKQISGGNLYRHHRSLSDGELLFLANSDKVEKVQGEAAFKTARYLYEMDAFTGDIKEYAYSGKEGRFMFTIPPVGSLLLWASQTELACSKSPSINHNPDEKVHPYGATLVKRNSENVLTIDYCDLWVDNKQYKDLPVFDASDKVYKAHGFHANPWNSEVQFKKEICNRDTFTTGGFTAEYRFSIEDDFDYSSIQAVVERPALWDVYINGSKIKNKPGEWWLDRDWGVYELSSFLKKGENLISVRMYPMSIHAELEQVFIIGDFSLFSAEKGWKIKAPVKPRLGSWKEQGCPFYYTDFSYIHRYHLKKEDKQYFVEIPRWNGTVAEVLVNKQAVGILFGEPYRMDVTPSVRVGDNEVEVKVVGSLKNLLGPFHSKAPLGRATPTYWKHSGIYPSGSAYRLFDYGLIDDFVLIKK